jgi:hypothetical protein
MMSGLEGVTDADREWLENANFFDIVVLIGCFILAGIVMLGWQLVEPIIKKSTK